MSTQKCFAAWAKSDAIRDVSSSGGIFAVLAGYVLDQKGIVFGAFQDENNNLYHIPIFEKKDLFKIQKSKYFQSEVVEAYKQAKQFLLDGHLILFSGTACQIAGLLGCLGDINQYKGILFTVEVLCHGVTNRNVYHRYLDSQSRIHRKKVVTSSFRTKEIHWKDGGGTSSTLYFYDGSSTIKKCFEDDFFIGFNRNLFLRPSCYHCPFTVIERFSDFMLGDYWGIKEDIVSLRTQEKGISLVLISSSRGIQLWNKVKKKVECYETDINDAKPFNMSLVKPPPIPSNRTLFFRRYKKDDFHWLIIRCCWRMFFYHLLWTILGDKGMVFLKKILKRSK